MTERELELIQHAYILGMVCGFCFGGVAALWIRDRLGEAE